MRVVLTRASGQLGVYVASTLRQRGHELAAWSGSHFGEYSGVPVTPVDLTRPAAIEAALERDDPEVVVHLAAVSKAEDVRRDPERGRLVNVAATGQLAGWCCKYGRPVVYTSTDLVFDGSRPWNSEEPRGQCWPTAKRSWRVKTRFSSTSVASSCG